MHQPVPSPSALSSPSTSLVAKSGAGGKYSYGADYVVERSPLNTRFNEHEMQPNPRRRSFVSGAAVGSPTATTKPSINKRKRLWMVLSIVGSILVGLIIFLAVFLTRRKNTSSSTNEGGAGAGPGGNFSTPNALPISQIPKPLFYAGANTTFVPGSSNVGAYRLARGTGGSSGVVAIHLGLMRDTSKVLMLDRWDIHRTQADFPDGTPVWAVEYDYTTDTYRPLKLVSNMFCAGGMLLPDSRLMVIGGSENFTDLGGIEDGMKSIRLFGPSGSPGNFGNAQLIDNPSNPKLQLASKRWYPSVVMLPEGRLLAIGGSIAGVSFTFPSNNTGTMELLPPLSPSSSPSENLIPLQFLWDTLPANLYPTTALLPSGRIFISAADRSTLLDPTQKYSALKTVLVRGTDGLCWGFPAPTQPVATTTTETTTTSLPTSLPVIVTSTPTPPSTPDGTRLPLSPCLAPASFNQNRTADSLQTFSFFATKLPQYYMTEPGDGVLFLTGSKLCVSVEEGGSVVLRRCNYGDSRQILRVVGGRILHVESGRCLGVGSGGVGVGDCTSSQTLTTLIDTSVYFEFPKLPGGPFRSYPLTGFGLLLPLDPFDNHDPAIMICGGSESLDPAQPWRESTENRALTSCGVIRPERPDADWEMEEMPTGRTLADLLHLPDGTVLLVNGARKGMAGWDLGRDPNYQAHLYVPTAPRGQRWHVLSSNTIPRLYHSTAQLLPDGRVMIAGSAPNSPTDLNFPKAFENEYRIEYYHPHYLSLDPSRHPRPEIASYPEGPWGYNLTYSIRINLPPSTSTVKPVVRFNLIQSGFRTHSTSFAQRLVWLIGTEAPADLLVRGGSDVEFVVGTPGDTVLPPGWYLLYCVVNGVPGVGKWVQVGGDPARVGEYYDV
ncbi:hypothetical protein HDU67_005214 [Dinochytrium kinnereticum]|nr:hypothetical protein HDU67_005214 [Dinochytrium kinnereticum]